MPRGGTRARSGPDKDPTSERSRRAAKKAAATKKTSTKKSTSSSEPAGHSTINVTALPSEGYAGRVPAFPLPKISRGFTADGRANRAATDSFRRREMEIWQQIWKSPQAAAWSLDSWRWPTVGEYCRIKAAVELDPDSNAALLSRLREYRNEVGLSPDGMKMNGWAIAVNQVAQQAAKKAGAAPAKKPTRRLRDVSAK